jgi:outer membrane protein TolC
MFNFNLPMQGRSAVGEKPSSIRNSKFAIPHFPQKLLSQDMLPEMFKPLQWRRLASLVLLGLALTRLQAQETPTRFSLAEAVDYATRNSPDNQLAVLDAEIAEHRRKELLGLGLPQVSGSLDIKDYLEIPTSLIPGEFFGGPPGSFIPVKFGTQYNATAGVSASQLIFSSDYFIGLEALKQLQGLTTKNIQRTQVETKVTVTKSYYSVLVNRQRSKLLDINIERLGQLLEDTKVVQQNGFAEQIDVDRLQVAYNNLLTERDKVMRLVGLTETLLKFQMGYEVDKPITLTDSLNLTQFGLEKGSVPDKVTYQNRLEYQMLQEQQTLNQIEMRRYQLQYLPTLVAYGTLQYNAQRNEFNFLNSGKWFPIGLVGVTLSVPIFDGFQKSNRIQQTRLNIMKTQININRLENAIDMEYTVARINYDNAKLTMGNQKANLDLAQNVYEVSRIKYSEGVGSNLEVINAEASLKEAQNNYYNAMLEFLSARVDLEKAAGLIR